MSAVLVYPNVGEKFDLTLCKWLLVPAHQNQQQFADVNQLGLYSDWL